MAIKKLNLTDPAVLHALMRRHGMGASHALGQNFLIDPDLPAQIADLSGADAQTGVLEVGPGVGTLTRELCARARSVVSVELDKRLPPVLAETLADYDNFTLIPGDILKTDISAVVHSAFASSRAVVCANLPYNITTPVISALLDSHCFSRLTLMVQREVGERIAAPPGSRVYGAFSLYVQVFASASIALDVPRTAFDPAPNVDSCVLQLEIRTAPLVPEAEQAAFFALVRAGFAQRRKTILNALRAGTDHDKAHIENALQQCGIDPMRRAETMSIEDFLGLLRALS